MAGLCMDLRCFIFCFTEVSWSPIGYMFVPGYALCGPAHLSEARKMTYYAIVLCLFLLTPLAATIFSYIKVAKTIQQHNADASSTIHSDELNRCMISTREIKLSKSLFAVVFAFMICWIPFWVIVILKRFHLVATMPRNLELLCMFFLYLSNTINPFIYAGMNPVFKREFHKLICCKQRHNGVGVSGGGKSETEEGMRRRIETYNSVDINKRLILRPAKTET